MLDIMLEEDYERDYWRDQIIISEEREVYDESEVTTIINRSESFGHTGIKEGEIKHGSPVYIEFLVQ